MTQIWHWNKNLNLIDGFAQFANVLNLEIWFQEIYSQLSANEFTHNSYVLSTVDAVVCLIRERHGMHTYLFILSGSLLLKEVGHSWLNIIEIP